MKRRPVLTCPDCGAKAWLSDWLPPKGYDPRLRMFKCDWGQSSHTFYKILSKILSEEIIKERTAIE